MQSDHDSMLDLPFIKAFVRTCSDGFGQGWHERNGGNLSYRLTAEEAGAVKSLACDSPGPWNAVCTSIDISAHAGQLFALTRSGSHMRNVADFPEESLGIIELDEHAQNWRLVWGFSSAGKPTSELASHLACHAIRSAVAGPENMRVLYHAHPVHLVALTSVLQPDSRTVTRALWGAMAECVMAIPEGVGVVPWVAPCGEPIALATAKLISQFQAVVWAHHGALAAGSDFDDAFSRMHVLEKAAQAYMLARAAAGAAPCRTVPDEGLRDIARILNLRLNEDFLG